MSGCRAPTRGGVLAVPGADPHTLRMTYNPLAGMLIFALFLLSLVASAAWFYAAKKPSEENLKLAAMVSSWIFGFVAVACVLTLMTILPSD